MGQRVLDLDWLRSSEGAGGSMAERLSSAVGLETFVSEASSTVRLSVGPYCDAVRILCIAAGGTHEFAIP